MATWVSLLRGVNVGGHNRLPMAALRSTLEDEQTPFSNVRTHLQSGNLITDSRHRSEEGVAEAVCRAIAAGFDLDVPVMVRSPAALRQTLHHDPFPEQSASTPKTVQVLFHRQPIEWSAELDELAAASGDRVDVRGRELTIAYGDAIHTSKLSPARLARILGQDGTARNWNTVAALVDLAGG